MGWRFSAFSQARRSAQSPSSRAEGQQRCPQGDATQALGRRLHVGQGHSGIGRVRVSCAGGHVGILPPPQRPCRGDGTGRQARRRPPSHASIGGTAFARGRQGRSPAWPGRPRARAARRGEPRVSMGCDTPTASTTSRWHRGPAPSNLLTSTSRSRSRGCGWPSPSSPRPWTPSSTCASRPSSHRLGGVAVLNLEGVQTRYEDPAAVLAAHR